MKNKLTWLVLLFANVVLPLVGYVTGVNARQAIYMSADTMVTPFTQNLPIIMGGAILLTSLLLTIFLREELFD